ncbi:hypothetical protein [Listeria newyorkensis]|uniref:hypothetical protein n=1 Tax=Listeria newyorkensis TaxID=1497681 RepID=UPI0015517AD6|nr:hypothetical protein [Listeria newyorkensis]
MKIEQPECYVPLTGARMDIFSSAIDKRLELLGKTKLSCRAWNQTRAKRKNGTN